MVKKSSLLMNFPKSIYHKLTLVLRFFKSVRKYFGQHQRAFLDLSYADKHEEGTDRLAAAWQAISKFQAQAKSVRHLSWWHTQKGSFHSSCPRIRRGSLILLHKLFSGWRTHTQTVDTREADFTLCLKEQILGLELHITKMNVCKCNVLVFFHFFRGST